MVNLELDQKGICIQYTLIQCTPSETHDCHSRTLINNSYQLSYKRLVVSWIILLGLYNYISIILHVMYYMLQEEIMPHTFILHAYNTVILTLKLTMG